MVLYNLFVCMYVPSLRPISLKTFQEFNICNFDSKFKK